MYEEYKKFLSRLSRSLADDEEIRVVESSSLFCDADNKRLGINFAKFEKFAKNNKKLFLAHLKAENYHALAHYLFTEFSYKDILDYCVKNDLDAELFTSIINILEDNRIEDMFIQLFPATNPYFQLRNHMIFDESDKENLWVRFIVKKFIHKNIKKFLIKKNSIKSKNEIIRLLKAYKNSKNFFKICHEVYNIVKREKLEKFFRSENHILSANPNVVVVKQTIKIKGIDFSSPKELEGIFDEILKDVNSEIKYIEKQYPIILDEDEKRLCKKLQQILKELQETFRSRWLFKQRSGILVMRDAMRYEKTGDDRMFKRYMADLSEKISFVIILHIDCSPSMKEFNKIEIAKKVCKALIVAFQKEGCKIKVYGFSSGGFLLKDWGDKNIGNIKITGTSTIPYLTLSKAYEDFKKFHDEEKINIIITDGGWFSPQRAEKVISNMNQEGIHTVEINIIDESLHNSKYRYVINRPEELPEYFKKAIRQIAINVRKAYYR